MTSGIVFLPINLERDWDLCLKFRIDSYVASFGSPANFERDGGEARYKEWLGNKLKNNPNSAVHLHFDGRIIGQMELGKIKDEADVGMVNLYYLAPEYRGKNLSSHLDLYAMSFLRDLGCKKARLNVSPTNTRALSYYSKNGWKSIGPNPKYPEVLMMEKSLESKEK